MQNPNVTQEKGEVT